MRVTPGNHIVHVTAGRRRADPARWRRTSAVAAALALPLAAVTLTAAPASAAVRYRVTHTISVPDGPEAIAVDSAARTAYVTKDDDTDRKRHV